MAVHPRIFGGPQVSSLPSVFTENFLVNGQTWGPDWCVIIQSNSINTGAIIWQAISVQGNRGRLQHLPVAGINPSVNTMQIPRPLMVPAFAGTKQFSECVIAAETSIPGNTNQYGVACFVEPTFRTRTVIDACPGYLMFATPGLSQILVFRSSAADVPGSFILTINAVSVGAGDTLRMEVVPTASDNTVTVYKNAVAIGSVVDNNANRPRSGYPAFFCRLLSIVNLGSGVKPQTELSQFSGGPL